MNETKIIKAGARNKKDRREIEMSEGRADGEDNNYRLKVSRHYERANIRAED